MSDTLELGLVLPEPEVSREQIEKLVAALMIGPPPAPQEKLDDERDRKRRAAGWMTADEIAALMDTTERSVRRIASAAGADVVSYPGSPGYKIWGACTVEQINHCIESFESQGKDMIKRAVVYRQAYHRRYRTPPPHGHPGQNS